MFCDALLYCSSTVFVRSLIIAFSYELIVVAILSDSDCYYRLPDYQNSTQWNHKIINHARSGVCVCRLPRYCKQGAFVKEMSMTSGIVQLEIEINIR